jgi:cysteine desulfurase
LSFQLERYFDYAATTPIDEAVREEMLPFLGEAFGNPNSTHAWGQRTRAAVELARERIAEATGWSPECVTFTASATEANNWVIAQHPGGQMSPFEHEAVRAPGLVHGYCVIPNDGLELLPAPGESRLPLVSKILVSNETGTVWNPNSFFEPSTHDFIHSDASQALGRIDLQSASADFMTFSSHKCYGPKGAAALITGNSMGPMLLGGEQEDGLRAGTLNVPAIVGFGLAAKIAEERREADWQHAEELRSVLLAELEPVSDWQVNGVDENWIGSEERPIWNVPHILSLSFLGMEGETLVIEADAAGFAISAGAACSSGSTEPSHVLTAMGVAPEWIRGTARISFGRYNSKEAARALGHFLRVSLDRLRQKS